jgi:hypothetical protein
MSSRKDIELLEADALYYRDRVALLRAKLYRWGLRATPQLRELERRLTGAEQRLRRKRSQAAGYTDSSVAGRGERAASQSIRALKLLR